MARFPSIDAQGAFEAPEVQNHIKHLVTGSTDGITLDTSVGTRVFVGDTMIRGDTGWRALCEWDDEGTITGDIPSGLEPRSGVAGSVQMRRINQTVYLTLVGFRTNADTQVIKPPAGHGPGSAPFPSGSATMPGVGPHEWTAGLSDINLSFPSGRSSHRTFSTNLNYTTTASWPTSLPGTPA